MIAAIYARKSTEQNGVADDQKSVARQIEHGRAYAASKGWIIDDASVFVDDGISGAEFANRPGTAAEVHQEGKRTRCDEQPTLHKREVGGRCASRRSTGWAGTECGVPNGNREQLHVGFHWDCGLRMGNIEGQRCRKPAAIRRRATTAKPLNVRQLLFVSEYLKDFNGAAAYQRTYGTKSLDVAGAAAARLLADVRVKALVAEGTAAKLARNALTADRVLEEYCRLAFTDIRKFFDGGGNLPVQDLDEEQAACLASLEVLVKNAKAVGGHTVEVRKFKADSALDQAPQGPRAQPAGKLETRGLLPGNQGHPQRESPPVARAVRAALGLRPRRRDVTVDSARIPVQLGARLRLDCRDCLAPLFSGRTIGVAAGRPDGVLTPSGRRLRFWLARQSAPRKSHRGRCCCCTRTSATSLPTTHLPPCSALS